MPPLFLLTYYYHRVQGRRQIGNKSLLNQLLLFFIVGVVAGLAALGWEWGFEALANLVVGWQQITHSPLGVVLRQLIEVGPIEEITKLGGVFLTSASLQHQHSLLPKQPSQVLLPTIAVALGFTTLENWVYLSHETASILDRLISTPVHAMFSAPWGYALGVASCSTFHFWAYRRVIISAWLNAVICHALVNVLSSAWRYPVPLHLLSYGLFPFLLWMFWRLEGLWRRSQNQPPINLISGPTRLHRYWRRGLAFFALMLGGNALFGCFLLARMQNSWQFLQIYPKFGLFLATRIGFNLLSGLIAWGIYRYLRATRSAGF